MTRWIRVTRNDAVIYARLCLSSPRRLSSGLFQSCAQGCAQVEWVSEPTRQNLALDPWKGRSREDQRPEARECVAGPWQATHYLDR